MSNPVSNSEVEDVLSSIRRLVSEDKRPQQAGKSFQQNAKPENDRLVLTPSLRVATTQDTSEPAQEEARFPDQDADGTAEYTSDLSLGSLVTDDEPLDVYGDNLQEEVAEEITTEDLATDYSADPYNFDDPDNVDGIDDAQDSLLTRREGTARSPEVDPDEREIEDAIFEELSDDDAFDDELSDADLSDEDYSEQEPTIEAASRQGLIHREVEETYAHVADAHVADTQTEIEQSSEPDLEVPIRRSFLSPRPPLPEDTDDMREPAQAAAEEDAADMAADDAPLSEPVASDETDVKAAALSAKIAALETAIGKISDTWEPDDAGESEYAGTAAPDVMAWEDDVAEENPFARRTLAPVLRKLDDIEEPEAAAEIDDSEEDAQAAEMTLPEDAPVTEAASVEQRFTSQRGQESKPEPETIVRAAEPEEALQPEPSVEPAQKSETAEAAQPEKISEADPLTRETLPPEERAEPLEAAADEARSDEHLGVTLPDDEQLLDEEALRDLVSEIVRSELQGALGERITRNVRKLVRREIHRALTAQELE